MPRYEFELEDENNPNVKHKVVVDEKVNLVEALGNSGVAKNKAGIRLYNQKYYTTRFDFDPKSPDDFKKIYLKKVIVNLFRKKEELVFVKPKISFLSEHLIHQ